jgi:outer membrane receptor for ferrienterochelin and colicins
VRHYVLEEAVVTASRSAFDNLHSPSSMERFPGSDLREKNVQSAADALSAAAGVDLRDYGGLTGAKLLSLRGSTGEQVIVLRNGLKINNPAHGLADLSLINLDEVESIEVYRGGASAIYGADAVGGVVNIITHRTKPLESFSASLRNSTTSFRRLSTGVAVHFPVQRWNASLAYRREYQPDSSYRVNDPRSGRSPRRVNSSMDSHALTGEVWLPGQRFTLSAFGNLLMRRAELPGTIYNNTSYLATERQRDAVWSLNPHVDWRASERWTVQSAMAYHSSRIDYNDTRPFIDSYTRAHHWSAEMNHRWQVLSGHVVRAGYSIEGAYATGKSREGDPESPGVFGFDSRMTYRHGLWLSDEATWLLRTPVSDLVKAYTTIRGDYHSEFGKAWSPKLGVSLVRRHGSIYHTLRASAGLNYRAPTLNERFWQGNGARGNPDILPEKSRSLDAGVIVGWSSNGHDLQAEWNLFDIRSRDQIVWLLTSPVTPANLKRTESSGFESILRYTWDSVTVWTISYTRTRAVDRSDPERTFRLLNSPLYRFNVTGMVRLRRFRIYGTLKYASERFVNRDNTVALDPYWLADIGTSYTGTWARVRWDVHVDVRNVLDTAYETVSQYPGLAREFMLTVGVRY